VAAPDHKIRQCIQRSALCPGRADGGTEGPEEDAENARHENAGLENAAQTCRLLQEVENARLENVAQNR